MYRNFAFIILSVLIFSGCTSASYQLKYSEKVFENEDLLILQALYAEQHNEIKEAGKFYEELYIKTQKSEYLKNSIKMYISQNDNSTNVEKLIQESLLKYPQDLDFTRLNVGFLIKQGRINDAKNISFELVKQEKSEQNLRLLGNIYLYTEEFELALKLFESAYGLVQNEVVFVQIADLLIRLDKKNEAIAQLETYSRIKGCTIDVCNRLLVIYGKDQNIDGILNTYIKLYKARSDDEYAQKIVEILIYQGKTKDAKDFLIKNEYKPEILMNIYLADKEYIKAKEVALKLYEETNDVMFLGRAAIFEYEGLDKKNKKTLQGVIEKFEIVVNSSDDGVLLNYYGYILIDHEIDIAKGIELVKKALLKEPKSTYYIDSYAWGLYKQKKCKEAYEVIKDIAKHSDEKEILNHYNLIKKCAGIK